MASRAAMQIQEAAMQIQERRTANRAKADPGYRAGVTAGPVWPMGDWKEKRS
jgi:hypothetical protein